MDNKRIFLWAAVGLLIWMNYITWQRDYPSAPTEAPSSTAASNGGSQNELPSLPQQAQSSAPKQPATTSPAVPEDNKGMLIHVVTDVLDVDISSQGGELRRADLPRYFVKGEPGTHVRLLSADTASLFLARSGLLAAKQQTAPSHLNVFTAEATEYRLSSGANDLPVKLSWTDNQGVTVTKTYVFHRGSYAVDLSYEVNNQSDSDWQAASYLQLLRHYEPVKRSMFDPETYAFRGPAIFNGKSYRRLDVESNDDRHFEESFANGWMAAMQHHFVVAAVPQKDQAYDFKLSMDSANDFTLTYRGPLQTVAKGNSASFGEKLFIGPKLQSQLEAVGPQLERTTDYGRLTIIARPLFLLLEKVHEFVGNWGVAIISVTFLIKLAFYKLTAASGRSMAKMRNLSPRIKAIQERYKEDREQLGKAMMEIYKKEKINPLAGCLPILIQIPFFMGFYWVLLESVEMRQAPFFGWIVDLSSRDPYFVLPILMGLANFVQYKLNPAPPDPMQAKIMAVMPLVMTVMMAWFPAGMVLYWITNTTLSVLQQWRINKVIEADTRQATA